MHAAREESTHQDLRAVMAHAEAEAERLLRSEEGAPLDAVAWLSAHLAALDQSVYPVAKRALDDGREVVAQHHELAGRLTRTLRVVERHSSGDTLAAGLSTDRIMATLREQVDEHALAVSHLTERLSGALTTSAQDDLVVAYEVALTHAPTRPHPHLPSGGLMFRVEGLRDRVLDAMDGRHDPTPKELKPPAKPGRWGSYWLGQPHDKHEDRAV